MSATTLALAAFAVVPAQLPPDATVLQLLDTSAHPYARCMDGSPGGFYVRDATGARRATTYVLDFEGGGECSNTENCAPRLSKSLGSSNHFPPTYDFSSTHFGSADEALNPDFFDANLVRLKYCSGDLWSGRRTEAWSPSGFWFSGHHIVDAILQELDSRLQTATEIIVTGESAGGAAVYTNLDFIAARYPQAAVAGAAIAGFNNWAFPYNGTEKSSRGPSDPSWVDFREPAWAAIYDLWDPLLNEECAAYYADYPATCLVECYKYKFVETPLFIFESQSDSV